MIWFVWTRQYSFKLSPWVTRKIFVFFGLKSLGIDTGHYFVCLFVCFISTGILFFTSLALSLSRLQIILNTSSEDFQRRLAVFYVWKESLPRGGIFFITTLPSPTGVTSTAGVSFLFFTTTSCFWVPLKQFFLFKVLLFTPDCFFPTFGMIHGREDK